jgi:LmbE family N-acetylglucosaminyl deacetylase
LRAPVELQYDRVMRAAARAGKAGRSGDPVRERANSAWENGVERWLSSRRRIHVLSPHVDDAIYSLGGWIARSPRPVVIHNILSVSRFTAAGLNDDAALIRRGEEEAALELLAPIAEIECRYHGLPDLSARSSDSGAARLERQIVDVIEAIGADPMDGFFVPAGVGAHPDHLLVAAAATPRRNAIRYCEIPYLMWDAVVVEESSAALDVDVELHIAAMSCFVSQVAPEVEWKRPLRDALARFGGLPVIA